MQLLSDNFRIFTLCGCWLPEEWNNSKCKSLVYNCCTLVILALLLSLASMKLINVSRSLNNSFHELAVVMFSLPDVICAAIKFTAVYAKRGALFKIEDTFIECINFNNDEDEIEIQAQFNKICRLLVRPLCFSTLCIVIPLELKFLINNSWDLLLEDYTIYEVSSKRVFWLSYVCQSVAFNVAGVLTTNFDTFIVGFMLQICCQIEILKCKLSKIPKLKVESQYRAIVECIVLHNTIYRLVDMTQKLFNLTFILQLTLITPNMAIYFYAYMNGKPGDPYHYYFLLSLSIELTQLLFYCWTGTEITSRSSQVNMEIYKSEWMRLNTKSRMALYIIMENATRPIVFTLGIFRLSIDTFTKLVKFIYTAYNMLIKVT